MVHAGPSIPTTHVGESGLRHLLLQLGGGMEEGVGESERGVVHAAGQHWHQLGRDVVLRQQPAHRHVGRAEV